MQKIKTAIIFSIILFGTLFFTKASLAATLTVGDGKAYSTIQAAVNAASSGDRIEVYSKAPNNTYHESIDAGTKNNITLVGMVSDQGVIVDGTGIGQLAARENVRLSARTGWWIGNLTFKESDSSAFMNVRIAAGGGHTITKCKFASTGGSGEFYELFFGAGTTNNSILQNTWVSTRTYNFLLSFQDTGTSNNVVKYNDFGGSGAYISLWLGTTDTEAYNTTIHYNYFHTTMDSNWLGVIYNREADTTSIKYNLIIANQPSAQYATGIMYRDDTNGMDVQHNTIIMPFSGMSGEFAIAFYGSTNRTGCLFKNNIIQGSDDAINNWDNDWNNPAEITYNYIYDPQGEFKVGTFANYGNNTETRTVAPGFVGSGTIWQTDGTDGGTVSQYYSLQTGSPALTACESGTFCGAFATQAGVDTTPPAPPTNVRVN